MLTRVLLAFFLLSSTVSAKELLSDPDMYGGIGYLLGTVKGVADNQCNAQYYDNGVEAPRWGFVEVCGDNCFCDNPNNPQVGPGYQMTYTAPGKELHIDSDEGTLSVYVDTSLEWNNGCRLNEPGHKYSEANTPWNWHHLLINQFVNIDPSEHESLVWSMDTRLDASWRTNRFDCPTIRPEHNLWYVALRIELKTGSTPDNSGGFALIRQWASGNNQFNDPYKLPFVGRDPVGTWVYTSATARSLGNAPLERDKFKHYEYDVKRLFNEAIASQRQKYGTNIDPDDYKITVVYFGYEIWGGFELGVTTKNMSLKADEHLDIVQDFNRYWNPIIKDHYYTTHKNVNGLGSWRYEGPIAKTPSEQWEGSIPLYEYWLNGKDHYYSTNLFPLGAGRACTTANGWCGQWRYAGIAAYVYDSPGFGRKPIYQMWHPWFVDHLYSPKPAEGAKAGYVCIPDCSTPAFWTMP